MSHGNFSPYVGVTLKTKFVETCSHWLGYLDCLGTACPSQSYQPRRWVIPSTSFSSLSLSLIQFSSSSSYSSTLLWEVRRGRLVNWFSKHFQQPRSWVFNYLVLSWPITVNSIIYTFIFPKVESCQVSLITLQHSCLVFRLSTLSTISVSAAASTRPSRSHMRGEALALTFF